MKSITLNEFVDNLKTKNTFFSCVSLRKNDKVVDGHTVAYAGQKIKSTYRFGVPATKKDAGYRLTPGTRAREDVANNVITVYDVTKCDNKGERGAFRRINLAKVLEIKTGGKTYHPVYDSETKQYMMVEV